MPRSSAPGTGSQLVQDPSFEYGPANPYWSESSSGGFENITPTNPHSGRYSVDLCDYTNDTPTCSDVVSQQLGTTIPSGVLSARLTYWFWIGSQEAANTCSDSLTVGAVAAADTLGSANSANYCAANSGDQQWHSGTIDLTGYLQAHAGQRLTVVLKGVDDANGLGSGFFVDDVGLSIYTTPGAPVSVLAQPDNAAATISWQAPPDGGSPITSYTITPYTNGGTTAGTPVVFSSPSRIEVMTGLLNGTAYTFRVTASNAYGTSAPSTTSSVTPAGGYDSEAASTNQYALTGSDGGNWQPIDANALRTTLTPAGDSLAVVTANVDLWTANAGFNQDVGIAVSGGTGAGTTYPTVGRQPEAWKESGGYAGTFSPNAASVQIVVALKGGSPYTFTLVWKTNRPAPGATIVAGAGPIGDSYSPTRMTVHLAPASGVPLSSASLKTAVSTNQFSLTGSNGLTWTDLGPSATPSVSFVAPADGMAFVSGNADLWTTVAGLNQDLGVAVQGGAYPTTAGQPELWKESGGYAGTFSPNAAAVHGMLAVRSGVTYTLKLQWKANRQRAGSIVAGAGPIGSSYSPTRLSVWMVPAGSGSADAVSTGQYALANSDGAAWNDMDTSTLKLSVTPTVNCVASLSANVDLWTANAGINQDLGIQVSSALGTYGADRVGWKEGGGYAGTFSPNAASVQALFPMDSGVTYTVKLQWKANHAAGGTIFAGAGQSPRYSPTHLSAFLNC